MIVTGSAPVTWQIVTLSYWYCAAEMELPATPTPPITPNTINEATATITAKRTRSALVGSVRRKSDPPLLLPQTPNERLGRRSTVE